jgi:hypothetical protein
MSYLILIDMEAFLLGIFVWSPISSKVRQPTVGLRPIPTQNMRIKRLCTTDNRLK